MTGRTHVAVGIACSLAILHPQTVPECLCAVTGGMIGGMISDIDSPGKRKSMDYSDDPYGWQVYSFIGIAITILLTIDYFAGNGAVEYILSHLGVTLFGGGIAFVGLCIVGALTSHRTFTHSILAWVLFTFSLMCFCMPLGLPFAIGFASHLFLDFFNNKKTKYFWPLPRDNQNKNNRKKRKNRKQGKTKKWLRRFPSDGKLNEALGGFGTVASIFLFAFLFINSFGNSVLLDNLIVFFSKLVTIPGGFVIPLIAPYLCIVNILAFVLYTADFYFYSHGIGFYRGTAKDVSEMESYIHTLLLIIDVAGGMLGKLIAVTLLLKGKVYKDKYRANFNFYIIPLCLMVVWFVIICTFCVPLLPKWLNPLSTLSVRNIPILTVLLSYFIIINIVTMVLLPRMEKFPNVITKREKTCLILSIFGGATGGYISAKITGRHQDAVMFSNTLPELMATHAIVLACLFYILG